MWSWIKANHAPLTAVGAMIVGLAALFVAWDQARVMRAQQHGAVYPALQIDGFSTSTPEEIRIGVRVANSGVGPAIVESVRLLRGDETMANMDPIFALLSPGYDQSWTSMNGRIIAPGDSAVPIEIRWTREDMTTQAFTAFTSEWQNWDMEVCYCSVFDRCWRNSTDRYVRPEPVRQCDIAQADIFETIGTTPPPAAEEQAQ